MKFKVILIAALVLFFAPYLLLAQSDTLTSRGIRVIRNEQTLQREISKNPDLEMRDLRKMIPSLILDLRYTTPQNFTHKVLYPTLTTTYLRRKAAESLQKVQSVLSGMHLGLKIFDAYRPWSVTEAMWQAVPDDRYAADPAYGSGHNRGIAVDLTLIDLRTLKDLPMGTGFDNFTDSAHRDFTALPAQVLANRLLLQTLMQENGFIGLKTEWWHFSLQDPQMYDVLDVSFGKLAQLQSCSALKNPL